MKSIAMTQRATVNLNESGLTQNPDLFVKKWFEFGHLVYLNSLIQTIFCLDLRVLLKSCELKTQELPF